MSHIVDILNKRITVNREISGVLSADTLYNTLAYIYVSCGIYVISLFTPDVC